MTSIFVASDFSQFDSGVQDAVRRLLDKAEMSSPFQDPRFCGKGAFGSGIDSVDLAIADAGVASFYGHGVVNFAFSRMLPFLRMVDFHKGPVADDLAHMLRGIVAIEEVAAKRGVVHVDINPQWTDASVAALSDALMLRGWRQAQPDQGSETLRLNVEQDLDAILANFRSETRHKVRRAQRSELRVVEANTDEAVERFYAVYRDMCNSKAIVAAPFRLFSELARRVRLNPAAGTVFVSYLDGQVCGGAVILRAGPHAHYVYGAVERGERYRSSSVGHALQWAGIQWAKQMGCVEYDFGGFSSTTAGGVPQFKRGFGGSLTRIAPRFRLVLRPRLYRIGSVLRSALYPRRQSIREAGEVA